ncbi:transposase [Nocardia aurea]|uniref:transposase n=1 Tax=Nocardia aurea TaxID=2144174 RepID=UPI000D6901D1|nr:transposase [Nocardia aurea]
MAERYHKFELLAIALDAQFGNIYEYNLGPDQVAGYDFQEWSDELRRAVRQFLLDDLPAGLWDYLSDPFEDEPAGVSKDQRADDMIERLQPGEVAIMIRHAAVTAVPTLRQLIGNLDDWPSEEERLDADIWLTNRGDSVHWPILAAVANHHKFGTTRTPSVSPPPRDPDDLVHTLTPGELLYAWEYVVGPADSDLTDEEWRLLTPHLGTVTTHTDERVLSQHERDRRRRLFNGIRFKLIREVPWSHLPARYGPYRSIYQMYRYNQTGGLFVRLREALHGYPAALQLVAWLDAVIADLPKKRHRSQPGDEQPAQNTRPEATDGHSA